MTGPTAFRSPSPRIRLADRVVSLSVPLSARLSVRLFACAYPSYLGLRQIPSSTCQAAIPSRDETTQTNPGIRRPPATHCAEGLAVAEGPRDTFRVSRTRREMYSGHARLCVCRSAAACPHYCADPDVTWGMVGVLPSCALLGGFAIGARVSFAYDNIARTRNVSECSVFALCLVMLVEVSSSTAYTNKISSGDEIANVNFFTRHRTCRGQRLCPLNELPNFYYKYLC